MILFQQFSDSYSPNLLHFTSNLFEICQMGEVGGFLPGGRLELRRSPDLFSSNPDETFAGFKRGERQRVEML
jgi:hypothetical protein